jgi:hypothetical protein
MNSRLNQNELQTLQSLSDKIDNATATLSDYSDYEALLIRAGISQEEIRAEMVKNNINDFSEYISRRQSAVTYQDRRITEAQIAGALVGIALFIIFFYYIKINDKKE